MVQYEASLLMPFQSFAANCIVVSLMHVPVNAQPDSLTPCCSNFPKTHICASWGSKQPPHHTSPGGLKCSYCSLMHPTPLLCLLLLSLSFQFFPAPPSQSPLGTASALSPSLFSSLSFSSLFSIFFLSNSHTLVPQLCTHFHCRHSASIFPQSSQLWCWDVKALYQWLNISLCNTHLLIALSGFVSVNIGVILHAFLAHVHSKDVEQISCIITGRNCLSCILKSHNPIAPTLLHLRYLR